MPHPVALRRSIFLCFALTTLLASRTLAHDVEAAGRSTDKNAISTRTVAGDVEIVVIDDRPNHATYEYRQLRQADGSLTVLRGSPAESLQTGSHVEVVGAHAGKTFVVSSVRALAKGVDINRATAQTIDIEGAFSIAHSDNFTAGKSEFIYELREDNGHAWSLELASSAPVLKGGMRIKANGIPNAEATSLRPSQIAILSADGVSVPTEKRAAIPEKALNTALVIMASFNNAAVPSMTQSDAQLVMISNASSVANFFNEASFGQQTFSVTVTNWVTMNIAKPATCNTSDWQGIGNAAATAAANGGWSPANYGFVVYLFPQVSACGWNGLAYIGSPHKAFINGTNSFVTSVIAHEMGHNFGLFHAGSVDCGSAPIGGSCTAAEYGDPFDTMGNQRAMHYNAQQKRKLNWISASSVATHTAGSAIYTLSPIESGGGSLYAVKIPTGSASRTYWVEFRQPIGFDSPLAAYPNNGAQIRVANPFEIYCAGCDSISDDTELLDMTPGTSSFNDATLVVGNAFHDSSNGLSISVQSASATALTIAIDFDRTSPAIDFDASGTMDVVWRNAANGTTSVSLTNAGSVGAPAALIADPSWVAIAGADFDGDGRTDLVWRNSATGQTAIGFMNGVASTGTFSVPLPPAWTVTHVGDLNGDGRADWVVRNASTGQIAIWLFNGATVLASPTIYSDPNWTVTHVGDFNGDGNTDLVWRNGATGQTAIWLMNGTAVVASALLGAPAGWQVTHVADLDGDGRSDLVWRNSSTGETAVWLMNGTATAAAAFLPAPTQWMVTQAADLDGDGKSDLVWRNSVTGQTAVWLMNGTTSTASAIIFGDAQWSVTLTGDANGDGKADLVWRNSATGATALWLMNGLSSSSAAIVSSDPSAVV